MPADLFNGDPEQMEIFLISRLPRLLAILCTGIGMSVAGLIMQQLCSNKFISPTTGATISSAQLGILLALLFMPTSNLWSRALFAFATAILGTWVFVWFIQRIRFKDLVMVPLVGIMFGNVIGGITSYLAYKYEMTQALSSWLVGHFSLVLKGRYEIVWLTARPDCHGHCSGYGICSIGRSDEQYGYLPCHEHDENRPASLRRTGENGDPRATRDQLCGILLRLYLCFQEWKNRKIRHGRRGNDQGESVRNISGGL